MSEKGNQFHEESRYRGSLFGTPVGRPIMMIALGDMRAAKVRHVDSTQRAVVHVEMR